MTVPIILSILGLALIYLEFFLPGGIMGMAGGVLLLISIVVILISDVGSFPLIIFIAVLIAALFFVIRIALWHVRKTSGFLNTDQSGYSASFYDKELIGKTGVVESDLKPSGYVNIDGKFYQSVSKGSYIQKGSKIQVIGGEGARLIVKAIIEE